MKKISAKYKLLMMMPLFVLTGCDNKEYKCIVDVVKDNKILATDLKTGKYKIFVMNNERYDCLRYVYPYDTIVFYTNQPLRYNRNSVVDVPGRGHLKFDKDSLYARQNLVLLDRARKEHWFKHR